MVNRSEHMTNAKQFIGKGQAYIHTEVIHGVAETVMAGDFMELLTGVVGEINRLGQITGTGFESVLKAIACKYNVNSEEFSRMMCAGFDTIEEYQQQLKLEAEKVANIEVAKLKIDNGNLKRDCENYIKIINSIKIEHQQKMESLQNEKLKLSKECKALEARMKEMEKRFYEDKR